MYFGKRVSHLAWKGFCELQANQPYSESPTVTYLRLEN